MQKVLIGLVIVLFLGAMGFAIADAIWVSNHCTVERTYDEMRADEDDLFGDDDQWRVTILQCDNGTQRTREVELDD